MPLFNLRGLGSVGACLPCAQKAMLGQLAPETQRDLVSGAVAFTLPLAYHLTAPKKWPRANVVVNLGAVVGLYFLTQWAWQKFVPVSQGA